MAFLITKELIFGFQILDLKDHFSASLKNNFLKMSLYLFLYNETFPALVLANFLEILQVSSYYL